MEEAAAGWQAGAGRRGGVGVGRGPEDGRRPVARLACAPEQANGWMDDPGGQVQTRHARDEGGGLGGGGAR